MRGLGGSGTLRTKAVAAAVVAALLSSPVARARPLDTKEKVALAATVQEFDTAMRGDDYERIIQTVPPKVISSIAKKAGTTVEELNHLMVEQMKTVLKDAKIKSFAMDPESAEYKELSSGAPYALIPTTTVIALPDNKRFKEKSHTLALLDDGKWFLLRVSDASQLLIMREVYPEFSGVEFPSGSMEVLNK